ncbi:MAG: hypothetical protein A3K60_01545 [Euryarchaeota archaeon RBG_19FT_COMBO_56_21]|nr:MAG: hypothetical protein A3K60_01545 [Euryarchaeota archaeon RBG_19FT_COMBO_56_21]
MDYKDLTEWMFSLERFGIKLGLENPTEFMSRIGNPQVDFRSVHVTGTNGKGSVCAFLASILQRRGLKVGLYISPHLIEFTERISINGKEISHADTVRLGSELRPIMEQMASEGADMQLTFFEFTTGLAFKYFSENKVDIAVVEVGLGGRLDATNVLKPDVGVITRIGLEHTKYLGNTIPEVAREKAGIIKSGMRVVTCERSEQALTVISATCQKKGASLQRIDSEFVVSNIRRSLSGTSFDYAGRRRLADLNTHLVGSYQAENAAAAIAAVDELASTGISVDDDAVKEGILQTKWPGRLDVISKRPVIIFDGSHNPDGALRTAEELRSLGVAPLTLVIACMRDKDVGEMVRALAPVASNIVVTQVEDKRALGASVLAETIKAEFNGQVEVMIPSRRALEHAISRPEGRGVCVIGSLYLVGEAVQWWNARKRG